MSTYRRNTVVRMIGRTKRKKDLEVDADQSPMVSCGENTQQFLVSTAMHGMRYVGDSKLSSFERFFFTIAIAIMFGLATYFISIVYNKWTGSPIIITLNSVSTSISEIPFPAVTVCNMNQARKSVVQNITKGTPEYQMLRSLCRKEIDENATLSDDTGWLVFREFLKKVSQSCRDMLITCRFAQRWEKCLEIFKTVLTDEGLCCTFNSVHKNYMIKNFEEADDFDDPEIGGMPEKYKPIEWTPENGFSDQHRQTQSYPRRAYGSGSHMGLTVMINTQSYDYYCSSANSKGFKVLLHTPTETPKIANYGFSITPGRESRVVVTPSISDATDQIRKIPHHQRRCIFENEGNLNYFKTYSRKNCQMECESRLLQQLCGCVMYYMPRIGENPVICNRDDIDCYTEVLLSIEMVTNETFRCDCLPGCFDVTYTTSVSTSELTPGMIFLERGPNASSPEYAKANLAVMHVFYTNKFFRSHSKEELIGFTDFLSNIGGLLGLFMGFSVLSLIEIVYFITIRPYCAMRKRRLMNRTRRTSSINNHSIQRWNNSDKRSRVWNIERDTLRRVSAISTEGQSRIFNGPNFNRRSLTEGNRQIYMD